MLAWMGGARKRKHTDVIKEAKRQRKTEWQILRPEVEVQPGCAWGAAGSSLDEPVAKQKRQVDKSSVDSAPAKITEADMNGCGNRHHPVSSCSEWLDAWSKYWGYAWGMIGCGYRYLHILYFEIEAYP